ncbi:MAG: class I SAM-dependent methyltransferase [Thalassospira sp.]|uniref:class I SAM-dependent methyltransferase n=1 Tax=Thalassospira sp. TaxID=1912094 RepID=UPI003A861B38
MVMLKDLACICGGRALRKHFEYFEAPRGETAFNLKNKDYYRAYYCCEACGHFIGGHELDLSDLYSGDYVDATYGGVAGMKSWLEKILSLPQSQSDNAARVCRISDFAATRFGEGHRCNVLDVGAGIGVFPAALKKNGWSVTAVEPDERTVKHLRDCVNVEAFCENLFDLSPTQIGYFDLVTFNKVLEHVEYPAELLLKSSEFLTDGGAIYVELPDVAASTEGQGREEFFVEHHHVFSPASFCILGERAGLSLAQLMRLREPSNKFTLAGFFTK